MKDTVTKEAFAKINLTLDVVGIREDGYHLVQMVMQSVSLHDTLTLSRIPEDAIRLSIDIPGLECDERNLIWKAADLIRKEYGIKEGVAIDLKKRIPMAAGLAGGSTDCAATLTGMAELFDLSLSQERIRELGLTLGADVPYCVMGKTALAEGIGEKLTPLADIPDCFILLAKPREGVSTGGVYKALDALSGYPHPDTKGVLNALETGDLAGITDRLCNVLENVTAAANPGIGKLKEQMLEYGAMGSLMSGSGPTVFGIFAQEEAAKAAAEKLNAEGFDGECFVTRPVTARNAF
ncbi:MAG: 4-(cytidine 5'-diphospho)-2-C-methyl-D-erythritol kinase [Lachnospiraceae bacterium]|nr:4-(cytidine 5'-diphospho)-2-C-methyl-D-erythritol kinase [Lachnospiraceae bacterium]